MSGMELLRWASKIRKHDTRMYSRFFLEEDAVNSQGKLTREKQKSVNKIGHGPLSSAIAAVMTPHGLVSSPTRTGSRIPEGYFGE